MDVIKAVIPAAGLGTRFLPYTKSIPKEMLPVLDKPAIQYSVQEAFDSDVKNICMILSKGKESIVNHFETDETLTQRMKDLGKEEVLSGIKNLCLNTEFSYIRQAEQRGLGHAVWLARHSICKEYFSVLLPDEIIISKTPALAQLIKVARQEKGSVLAVQEVPIEETSKYGIIGIKKQLTPNLFQVSHLIEKPEQKEAPSNLAIIGRYVLSSKIFAALEYIETGIGGELQLTDAIGQMIHNNEKVFAYKVQGMRYDIGNPLGWLKANIGCALQDPNYQPYINSMLADKELMDSFIFNPARIKEHTL